MRPKEEETGVDDFQTFTDLCEANLPVKPSLAQGRCCIRVGKSSLGMPRRLLVRLSSEQAASDMLRTAPALRQT